MDFSSLPDNVFLQIFRSLPFKDRLRAGGVNSAFRRISKIAISETKVLDFEQKRRKEGWTPIAVSAILNLCAENLEEIRFNSFNHRTELSLVEAFANYDCPNLKKFHSNNIGGKDILNVVLRNKPNLNTLVIRSYVTFPDITMEHLETLHCDCDGDEFRFLMGRVPNLKHLTMEAWFEAPKVRMLDDFLGTVPKLETLKISTIGESGVHLEREPMTSFWQLKNLTELHISDDQDDLPDEDHSNVGDNALMKIPKTFPRLRIITLPARSITDRGVAALASLENLEQLVFECKFRKAKILDEGIRELVKCERLRKLRLGGFAVVISPSTLTSILGSFPSLSAVDFYDLLGVNTRDQAAAVIASLGGLGKDKIRLTLDTQRKHTGVMWKSEMVKRALKKLEDETGVVVNIRFMNLPNDPGAHDLDSNQSELSGLDSDVDDDISE